jgi:hypothetical protein
MPGNKLVKIVAVSAIALIGGLISCSLEPSTDSSIVKTASLPAGLPAELAVYEPRVTFDGTTTTLTYNVRADFSGWTGEESKIVYTAQKTAATAANADPQSVEALLWYYGETGETGASGLFDTSAGVVATTGYPLKSTEPLPRYVIIPLDTSLIKEYLLKKYPGAADFPNLVWIEENPAIGKVETENGAWADGKYEGADLRIS